MLNLVLLRLFEDAGMIRIAPKRFVQAIPVPPPWAALRSGSWLRSLWGRESVLGTFIFLTGLALAACGRGGNGSRVGQAPVTQTSEGGQVTIKVTWQGPSSGPMFTVSMDTHSVDLDGYDLRQLAVLRTDQGVEVEPTDWDAPKGGHHRQGTLTFPVSDPEGRAIVSPDVRAITLIIRDVAGIPERQFQWTW